MKNPSIALLKKQLKKLDAPDFDLEAWKVSCLLQFEQLFGKNDPKTVAVRELKIDYSSMALRDAGANYQPLETSKRKGREIVELAIDQLEMMIIPESELKKLLDAGDKEAILHYLKKQKKEDLVDLIAALLIR
jgi:hypothetical protein